MNSFQTFKFMALYSAIQFTCVVTLYWVGTNLTDWQVSDEAMYM